MQAFTCPNCGAPIDAAAESPRVVQCGFCQRTFERDAFRASATAPSVSPRAGRGPLLVFVAAGAALTVSCVLFFVWRGGPAAPPTPRAPALTKPTSSAPRPATTAPATTRTAPSARDEDAGAQSLDVESGRVTLTWAGRLVSSTGAAPPAGSPCTLTATVASRGTTSAHQELLTLQCQGKVLYDSSVPLNGMASTRFGLDETPVAGEVRAFVYGLRAEDVGSRSAPRAQIALSTVDGVMEAFRDTIPSFHVRATVERSTAVRHGKAVLANSVPPFDEVVVRKAKVVSKTGAVPFAVPACEMRISPAYQTKHTCRVVLSCGGRAIYGGASGGFDECLLADRRPLSFVDAYPTPSDGDPQLNADLAAGTATLGDTSKSGATYSVTFALSEP